MISSLIYGINPTPSRNPRFFPFKFQVPKRRPNHLSFYGDKFYGRKKTWSRRKQANGGRTPKRGWPMRPLYLATWGPLFWPSWLRCHRSFSPKLPRDLKPTIYMTLGHSRTRAPPKHKTPKRRSGAADWRENSGGALPAWSPSSPTTSPPSP